MQSSPNHHALLSLIYAFHSCLNKVILIFSRHTVLFHILSKIYSGALGAFRPFRPILNLFWTHFWPILNSFLTHLGSISSTFRLILDPFQTHFGPVLEPFWTEFLLHFQFSIWLCSIFMTIPIILATRLRRVFMRVFRDALKYDILKNCSK